MDAGGEDEFSFSLARWSGIGLLIHLLAVTGNQLRIFEALTRIQMAR